MENDFTPLRNHLHQFIKLSDADWQMLLPDLHFRIIKKHGLFEQEGKKARDIGYILTGNMRHFYTNKGEEKTTCFYFENTLVASLISCLTGQPSQLTIQALTDTKLIVFPYSVLQKLYDLSHSWERFVQ